MPVVGLRSGRDVAIDPNSGVLTYTPPAGTPSGPVSVTVVVADGEVPALRDSKTFTIHVQAAGHIHLTAVLVTKKVGKRMFTMPCRV
jgi:hypothetical protein